jgi:SLT domain-containing protein
MLATIGIFILIAAAVAALVIVVVKNWQSIVDFMKKAVSDVVSFVEAHWGLLLSILIGPIGLVIQYVVDHFTQITHTVESVLDDVVNFFTALPDRIIAAISAFGSLFLTFLETYLIDPIVNNLTVAVNWFEGLPDRVITALASFLSLFNSFLQSDFINPVTSFITTAIVWFEGLPARVIGALGAWAGMLGSFFTGTLLPTATSFIDAVVNEFASLPGKVMAGLANLATDVGGVFEDMLSDVRTPTNTIIGGVNILISGLNDIAHPEYIIATDPAYRARNTALLLDAARNMGVPMFATGGKAPHHRGFLGSIGHDISHAAGDVVHGIEGGINAIRTLAASAILKPIFDAVNHMIDEPALPEFLRGIVPGLEADVTRWVAGPVKRKAGPAPGAGGIGTPVGAIPAGAHLGLIAQALALAGQPVTPSYEADINTVIVHESGWDPNIINKWDSNWRAGHPSEGLMQTVIGTFDEYALPGHNTNIFDPISNIIAGIRYAVARYGSIGNIPGIVSLARGGGYVGYDRGGILWPGEHAVFNHTGGPELVLTGDQARTVFSDPVAASVLTGAQSNVFGGATRTSSQSIVFEDGAFRFDLSGAGDVSAGSLAAVRTVAREAVVEALTIVHRSAGAAGR